MEGLLSVAAVPKEAMDIAAYVARTSQEPNSPVSFTNGLQEGSSATGSHLNPESTSSLLPTPTPSPHSSNSDLGNTLKSKVDVDRILERLQQPDLTGQVVAWGWDNAAQLSQVRRAPPVALLAGLWPALHAVVSKCTAQDVLEIIESWMQLLQAWPRHFRLTDTEVVRDFTNIAVPAAVKRMSEQRLSQLATLCKDISLHPIDPALAGASWSKTASPRDIMRPIYAITATEVAIRVSNPARYVSPATISMVLNASVAWRWTLLKYNDTPALMALKDATQSALHVLRNALDNAEDQQQQ